MNVRVEEVDASSARVVLADNEKSQMMKVNEEREDFEINRD